MNSNSKGIMQCSWQNKASEDATWDSFAAYNAISLMANMPTYADNLQRDAYSNIEAEDLDYCKGLISENSGGTSGGRSLGGVKNGNYAAYYNIDFGETGASKLTFKYSREVLKKKMQMEYWNLGLEAQQDHLLQRQALKIQEHGRTGRK